MRLLALRRRWWRQRLPDDAALRAYFAAPPPPRRSRLQDVGLLALDFETTGLATGADAVVSAGWVHIAGGAVRIDRARDLRLRPRDAAGVGDSAAIHGLRDVDLGDGDDEASLLAELLPELGGRVLLAHGAGIEAGFIDAALRRRHRVPLLSPRVCTLALEARLRRDLGEVIAPGGLALAACRARYGLPAYREHDALSDALACAELFMAQVALLGGFGDVRLGRVMG